MPPATAPVIPFALDMVHQARSEAAMAQLPDACIDAVIQDPPYSSGGQFRGDRAQAPSLKYVQGGDAAGNGAGREFPEFEGDTRDQRGWLAWMSMVLSECYRVMKPSGYILQFTDWRMLPTATDALQAGGFVWRGVPRDRERAHPRGEGVGGGHREPRPAHGEHRIRDPGGARADRGGGASMTFVSPVTGERWSTLSLKGWIGRDAGWRVAYRTKYGARFVTLVDGLTYEQAHALVRRFAISHGVRNPARWVHTFGGERSAPGKPSTPARRGSAPRGAVKGRGRTGR